ncbi:GPI ethanolamine phosphate transferase 3-like protein [Xylariaceae sp. FL1272]|nr:GPI ethanolamine phosphate transferase 3-like protein [Xylariaceae sp. FL1272]
MPPSAAQNAQSKSHAEYQAIAAQWAKAKRAKELQDAANKPKNPTQPSPAPAGDSQRTALEARRKSAFEYHASWTLAFWVWLLCMHAFGIVLFTSGFLLTRLVLDKHSECAVPPSEPLLKWDGSGTIDGGCWHPKTFDKAVIIVIDALRYDFTIPVDGDSTPEIYHNAFPFLHESASQSPHHAVLRPFIADPPTSTLQRIKGLTTGTLPTFIDVGSSFGGTAIEEDNLLMQWRNHGKRIAHLGDDTWTALFPGYFEPNISKAYDSFNVWDLHTVDNGVIEHIFPLMQPPQQAEWDIVIGHLLGVDHAGHRYGPNHPAMTSKLEQMDTFIRQLADSIDDNTLLVVMGDHGMDEKGDHGGESDDEVEAALWMYSKRPIFGRTQQDFVNPPVNAKVRPVNQIDLVPTLALLLGIPIPYNNLGRPIEEAFAGTKGTAWDRLAAVSKVASAGIMKYQESYFQARGLQQRSGIGSPAAFWQMAENLPKSDVEAQYLAYTTYQEVTLGICKDLWARFDVPKMVLGIATMAFGVIVLLLYVSRDEDDDLAVLENEELDFAEKSLELMSGSSDAETASHKTLAKSLVLSGTYGAVAAGLVSFALIALMGLGEWLWGLAAIAIVSMSAVTFSLLTSGSKSLFHLFPNTYWGWLSVCFTASQSIGFASNSYTIWEDSISLFFLATLGITSAVAALRRPIVNEKIMGTYHSLLFVVLSRVASFSKLCREEQMPYCQSTYYASANSSTSAPWQLVIPFAVFVFLPSILKSYLQSSRSYEGFAPIWIGYIFRAALLLSAGYWTLDAASNGNWLQSISETTFKLIHVSIAQVVLALALVAGSTAFIWAPPCVSISTTSTSSRTAQVTVLGYGNANGARYLLLPINVACACILLSKPMGSGAIAIMLWQILALAEILDINAISSETIGPVTLALLGNYHYFKTGHQAALSSIQWDSAFIPLVTIRYPWSALAVMFNHFAGQIIACVSLPLLVLWKTSPKRKGVLESVSRALGVFVAYYAVESLATMAWTGHLRRHLMLYRVFNPRFMMAAAILLIVDLIGILITLVGVRTNVLAISDVFGFAD